jgi:flagellar basal-body rod protein FlgF/flagellar basal-body rod protein FlgG
VDSGFYSACAGLAARIRTLEIAADNLANINTAGFKSQQPSFRSYLMSASLAGPANVLNSFAALSGTQLNLRSGQMQQTGNDFDLALEGDGFFAVQTKAGVKYTRNGQLMLATDRTLVNALGDPVLGTDGPIRLPAGQMNVSGDGTVSVDGALVGRLRLASFASGARVSAVGQGYYDAADAPAQPAREAVVRQGALEQSNVDPVGEAVGLVALQRHAEMLQRAMAMFYSEMNRVAAEDIAKV